MRVLAAVTALALLAPLSSAQDRPTAERDTRRAPTYGEAAADRAAVPSERVVTRYTDRGEPRQYVERTRRDAPQWIRDEARAFRAAPPVRTARRATPDGVRFRDGSRYRGEVARGLPHGEGTMRYGDGASYAGVFRNGLPHGEGTLRTASGDVLVGTFRDGVLTDGEATYAAGHRYEGAFRDGRPHGQGAIDYADGSSYEGAFRSGRPDGWGTYRDADGERFEGAWNRGRFGEGGDRRRVDRRRGERRRSDRRRAVRDGAWR